MPIDQPATVIIRAARATDQKSIRSIVRAAGINPLSLHWQNFLVADDSGLIVGTGQVKRHSDGSRELASIAVIPSRQREGIAARIIGALLARETEPLYLVCAAPLESFYRRFGFHRIDAAAMPPYFRRIYTLARVAAPLYRAAGSMLVMNYETPR